MKRLKSFAISLGSLIGATVLGVVFDPEFLGQLVDLIKEEFGSGLVVMLVIGILNETFRVLHNKYQLGKVKLSAKHTFEDIDLL